MSGGKLRTVKAAVFSTVFLLSLFAQAGMAMAQGYNADVNKSIAVVAISIEQMDPETGVKIAEGLESSGTGFFIAGSMEEDPEYIVTNYHVVSEFAEYGQGQWVNRLVVGKDGKYAKVMERVTIHVYYSMGDYEQAYLVANAYDSVRDIAVLRLEKPTDKRVPIAIMEPSNSFLCILLI